MCRLLGYIGPSVQLYQLLYQPEHSLITQSYQPQEMTSGLLNADGFGVGWYDQVKQESPYIYKNILPIWNDINLPQISRYVESECILGYVRSATPPLAVDFSNCQPFSEQKIIFIHNGFITDFRETLYRPIRNLLSDRIYQSIYGTTDSEHIFALIMEELTQKPDLSLKSALTNALNHLTTLARKYQTKFSANIMISDGKQLVACRYGYLTNQPTLYYLENSVKYFDGVIITSEPLFSDNWISCAENTIISVGESLAAVEVNQICKN